MKRIDTTSFDHDASKIEPLEGALQLAKRWQPELATTFEDLLGNGGPPDETADEMIRAIEEWRKMPSTRSLA